jgi:lysine 2,3-aminomutase
VACGRLADAGIPLGGQMVLLKGVNDDPDDEEALQGLLKMRVKPYYLHQCDAIAGSAHFRTIVSKGLERSSAAARSHHGLRGAAVHGRRAPGGGGKVPLLPDATSSVARATTCSCATSRAGSTATPTRQEPDRSHIFAVGLLYTFGGTG